MTRMILTALVVLAVAPAFAEGFATGDAIRAAVAGNTVQGGMIDTGAYTEFYGDDGVIRGAGYTGAWTIENDQMCFDYGEGPDCWSVRIDGENVTWVKDGVDQGSGTIVTGNPNDF